MPDFYSFFVLSLFSNCSTVRSFPMFYTDELVDHFKFKPYCLGSCLQNKKKPEHTNFSIKETTFWVDQGEPWSGITVTCLALFYAFPMFWLSKSNQKARCQKEPWDTSSRERPAQFPQLEGRGFTRTVFKGPPTTTPRSHAATSVVTWERVEGSF